MKVYELYKNELPYLKESKDFATYNISCRTSEDVSKILCETVELHKKAEEYVYMLALDNRANVIGICEVAHGQLNQCVVNVKEVCIRSLLFGANAVILAHNHASGSREPSMEDKKTTLKMKKALHMVGITLFDHVIIYGDHLYYSFLENNEM